jgi:hypothetical protein
MVTVINRQPGGASMAGEALGQGLGQSLDRMFQGQRQKRQLQSLSPLFEQLGVNPEGIQGLIQAGLAPEQAISTALELGKLRGQYGQKTGQVDQKKHDAQAGIQRSINSMAGLISENASGIGISPLTAVGLSRKGVQNRAQYQSMRSGLEKALVPLIGKGTLSDARFKFILSQIPEPDESQRSQLGKLKGLAISLSEEGFPIDISMLEDIERKWDSGEDTKKQNDFVLMESPDGKVRQIPKSQARAAQQAGGKLIR